MARRVNRRLWYPEGLVMPQVAMARGRTDKEGRQ